MIAAASPLSARTWAPIFFSSGIMKAGLIFDGVDDRVLPHLAHLQARDLGRLAMDDRADDGGSALIERRSLLGGLLLGRLRLLEQPCGFLGPASGRGFIGALRSASAFSRRLALGLARDRLQALTLFACGLVDLALLLEADALLRLG
jgi:hypothetical protein